MTYEESLSTENSHHNVESSGNAYQRQDEVLIAWVLYLTLAVKCWRFLYPDSVMGSTGTGKSSVSRMFTYRNMLAHSVPLQFIRLMSGDTSVDVGDSLESETSKIQVVRFFDQASGRNVVLVDTPGFDDSRAGVTDTDILKEIAQYLLEECACFSCCPLLWL